jgi:hypothetical protein
MEKFSSLGGSVVTVIARYDGRVFVPEGTVELPVGHRVHLTVQPEDEIRAANLKLLTELEQLPDNPDWPADGSAQLDHYLYGTPKRP